MRCGSGEVLMRTRCGNRSASEGSLLENPSTEATHAHRCHPEAACGRYHTELSEATRSAGTQQRRQAREMEPGASTAPNGGARPPPSVICPVNARAGENGGLSSQGGGRASWRCKPYLGDMAGEHWNSSRTLYE